MSYRYDLPEEIQVEMDGPVRVVRFDRAQLLNHTEELNSA